MAGRTIGGALTALVFLAAGLFGQIHESTTKHVTCSEHGEAIHVDNAAVVDLPEGAAESTGDATLTDSSTPTHDHAHDHCVLGPSNVFACGAHPLSTVATAVTADAIPASIRLPASSGDELYRVAPKTSPPA